MIRWVRNHLIEEGLEFQIIRKFELAFEEAIVNIIQHAYQGKEGEIELSYKSFANEVQVAIIDHGSPFNPLTDAPKPDLSSPLNLRKEGGLGVFLMNQCVDDFRYQRDRDANILTLIKHFSRKK